MIYLGGESSIWNGITVLPDYGNPKQFHYLPPAPRLAVDPATGRKVFKLIKLAGGLTDPAGDGIRTGVVFFDCDLGLTADELAGLEDHVRERFRPGAGQITLAPLLYKDGEVGCFILGEQSWEPDAPPERRNLFVERLQGFGKPSLHGDNRASFSARMTQEGATVLERSLAAGGPIGISIVYHLRFDALQPAFKLKVEARWEEIYHYLENKCGLDLMFFSVEKTSIVEELEQNQLLSFEEVLYDASASGEVQQLRKHLEQYILEKFFTPVLSAGDPKFGKVPGMIADIARALVVGANFGFRRRELTQEERRSLSYEASRIAAIERAIHPQANLLALIPPADVPSYTVEVNSDADPFFRQLDVQCVLGGFDFAKSKIAWVHPRIRYGSAPQEGTDRTFTSMSDRMAFKAWLQRGHGFEYRASYEVEFQPPDDADPDAIYGKDLRLAREEFATTDRVLAINPRELFAIRSVELAVKQGFPWDRYPGVVVHVKHEDSSGYRAERSYRLTAAAPSCAFRARLPGAVEGVTQYRAVFYPSSGREIRQDWQVARESIVVIDDPVPASFVVRVHVAEPAAELAWADVALRYEDPNAPGVHQEGRLFFEDVKPQVWKVNASDPTRRRYEYRFTVFFKDDSQLESAGWIESDAPTLTLGRRIAPQRTVIVSPEGASFDAEQLRDVKVTLWAEGSADAKTELLLESPDPKEFTYRARDATRVGYAYELLYRWRNGRTRTVEGASPAGALTLRVPTHAP